MTKNNDFDKKDLQDVIAGIEEKSDSYLLISVPKDLGMKLSGDDSLVLKTSDVIDAINNNPTVLSSRWTDFQAIAMGAVAAKVVLEQLDSPAKKGFCAGLLCSVIDAYVDDEEDL